MNAAAEAVMKELPDLVMAYGNSDEFRYVEMCPKASLHRDWAALVCRNSRMLGAQVWGLDRR
jgi:tRNA(His) 5'-end guanylyltransferase